MSQQTWRQTGGLGKARRAMIGVAVGVVWLVSAPSTFAQGGGGGGGFRGGGPDGMFGPPVSNKDLQRYAEVLNLTPDQEEAAKALLQGYQEAYQQQAQAMRDKMDAMRESGGDNRDPANWDKIRKGFDDLRESRKQAEASFTADLKSVLTPEQTDLWPKAEREVRREKTLGRGLLSGESVDVVQITQDLVDSLPEADRQAVLDAVNPILEQYSQDLDRELVARNEAFETGMSKGGELMAKGDMDAVQALFEKSREASDRVRDVNQRYARQVEALLPEADHPAFESAVKKASFPDVYRETYGAKVVAAAAGFADLDENQKATVRAIADSYNRDLAAANEKMTAAILESEKNMTVGDMFRGRGQGGQGGGRRQGMAEMYQARRDLDDSTVESLKKVLTPEQFAKLPARQQRGGPDGGPGGRGDPGNDAGGANPPRRRTF